VKLKKAVIVATAAAGMVLAGSPALAATGEPVQNHTIAVADDRADDPTFGDAVLLFIEGGGALGYGAAALVAGAYTGIALTPALVFGSFGRG
jgi:hypothetical protein